MENYYKQKNKISAIHDNLSQSLSSLEKIKKVSIDYTSLDNVKKVHRHYIYEEQFINNGDRINFSVELENFPEIYYSFIKVIPIVILSDMDRDNYELNKCNIEYDFHYDLIIYENTKYINGYFELLDESTVNFIYLDLILFFQNYYELP